MPRKAKPSADSSPVRRGKVGKPRSLLTAPTSDSVFVRELQAAYIAAGQPELRAFALSAGVSYHSAYELLKAGHLAAAVATFERCATKLGVRLIRDVTR